MSKTELLTGQGAVYVRVSTDEQDTERQYEATRKFLSDHGLKLEEKWWFEDKAFRDNEGRPDFRRLLDLAGKGLIQWVVVDSTERFAMKSTKRFIGLLGDLEEWGCKLFTVDGKEWTEAEISTEVQALIKGHESYQEGVSRSYRVLGKLALMARDGLYLGGLPPFGFDVATFLSNSDFEERWRVVWQPELGKHMRLKVWPDGTVERSDGKGNMPPIGNSEVRRLVPCRDHEKLSVVREAFERYAVQQVSFNVLAGYLNELGYRAGGGSIFTATHIPEMLSQPAYIGTPGWNRRHVGKFHGWSDGKQTRMSKPTTKSGKGKYEKNEVDEWIVSNVRWYEPLVDEKTWNTVQEKLRSRIKKHRSSRSPSLILSGVLLCGHCGQPMSGGNRRMRDGSTDPEYYCATYHRWVSGGRKEQCKCLRHTVKQSEIVEILKEYLNDVSDQLDAIEEVKRSGNLKLLKPFESRLVECVKNEADVLRRMFDFIFPAKPKHKDIQAAKSDCETLRVWQESYRRDPVGFEEVLADYYAHMFDSRSRENQRMKSRLEAQLDTLIEKHKELPTEAHRSRKRLHQEILDVESHLNELDLLVENLTDKLFQLDDEIISARQALLMVQQSLKKDVTADVFREQAHAVSSLIKSVSCTFSAVGEASPRKTGQIRKRTTVWNKIVVVPKTGDPVTVNRGYEDTTDNRVRSRGTGWRCT